MSRICEITGRKPRIGNRVSHSNIKTKRRLFINLQNAKLKSDILQITFPVKASTRILRTITNKYQGLYNFLLSYRSTRNKPLTEIFKKLQYILKKKILKTSQEEKTTVSEEEKK